MDLCNWSLFSLMNVHTHTQCLCKVRMVLFSCIFWIICNVYHHVNIYYYKYIFICFVNCFWCPWMQFCFLYDEVMKCVCNSLTLVTVTVSTKGFSGMGCIWSLALLFVFNLYIYKNYNTLCIVFKFQFSGGTGKGQSAFASLYTNGGVPCR